MKSRAPLTSYIESCVDPIFVFGILPRSGTNYLHNLLLLHPDCGAPDPIWEDHLLRYADLLLNYAQSVSLHWHYAWGTDKRVGNALSESLGKGLLTYLTSLTNKKRLLTKTPSVVNLQSFFKLFPSARLIILVRDGRSVVESGVKSFGWNYEVWMQKWANAALTICEFDKTCDRKYFIMRYEDLFKNVEGEMRRMLSFLELDAGTYDFDAAARLPIIGSSVFRGGQEKVHWKPVERRSGFDPVVRWAGWNRAMHERFNWLAGQYLSRFGYEEVQYKTYRPFWALWNTVLDIKWRFRCVLQAVASAAKSTCGTLRRGISRRLRTVLHVVGLPNRWRDSERKG